MTLATRLAQACLLIAAAAAAPCQSTPDAALKALQEGNRRFAADRSTPQPLGEGVRRTLARGQSPIAIVLCCADSRVPPEHVFNMGLGELFVVRIAGHACDAETLASIEYAVEHLNVPLCVVLGHEGCGAVAACIAQVEGHGDAAQSPAVRQLLEQIEPAVRKGKARDLAGKDLGDACEEQHVHDTIGECLRRSELLRRYTAVARFRMVPARYHLQSGEVEWLPNRPPPAEPAAAQPVDHDVPMGLPPQVALRLLQAGHRRYLGSGPPTADLTARRREQLTHGQQPLAIVVTCADSRTAPEHVFDAGLGELFVIRMAGNALNDDALASIEYAAAHTGASLLVVMGHTGCGAVEAATENPEASELTPNLRALLTRLEPPVAEARASGAKGRDLVDLAVRANALRTLAETRSRSALLRDLEAKGRFALLPAVYDTATGDVTWLDDPRGPAAIASAGTAAAPSPHAETAPLPGHPTPVEHAATAGSTRAAAHAAPAPAPAPEDEPAPGRSTWLDPTLLASIAGVTSLLLAALLLLKKRSLA